MKKRNRKGYSKSQFLLFVILIIIICAIGFYLIDQKQEQPAPPEREHWQEPNIEPQKPNNQKPEHQPAEPEDVTPSSNDCGLMLLPVTQSSKKEQIIEHIGYTTSFNNELQIPNWVAYVLTKGELKSVCEREGAFVPDPQVKGKKISTNDYKGTGFDRGHMAPAADMKWNKDVMNESFYLSNVCPQHAKLNRGRWLTLEDQVRDWARQYDSVLVICGPIIKKKKSATIGKNKITVPDAFFKIVARYECGQYSMLGFIFPNEDCDETIFYYSVTVDSIEKATGHNFFECLDDNLEETLESQLNVKQWN